MVKSPNAIAAAAAAKPVITAGDGAVSISGPTREPRMLRATESFDVTESPRRSDSGEGSILDTYNKVRMVAQQREEERRKKKQQKEELERKNHLEAKDDYDCDDGASESSASYSHGALLLSSPSQSSNRAYSNRAAGVSGTSIVFPNTNSIANTNTTTSKIKMKKIDTSPLTRRSMQRRMSAGPTFGSVNAGAFPASYYYGKPQQLSHNRQDDHDEDTSTSYLELDDSTANGGDNDESECESMFQTSIHSGAGKYLSDPSVYSSSSRRYHSDGSTNHSSRISLMDENISEHEHGGCDESLSHAFESPRRKGGSLSSNLPAGSLSTPNSNSSRSKLRRIASSGPSPCPSPISTRNNSPAMLRLLKQESDRKLRNFIETTDIDDDDVSIHSIRSSTLEDLKQILSTSGKNKKNLKTVRRSRSGVIRSSSPNNSSCGSLHSLLNSSNGSNNPLRTHHKEKQQREQSDKEICSSTISKAKNRENREITTNPDISYSSPSSKGSQRNLKNQQKYQYDHHANAHENEYDDSSCTTAVSISPHDDLLIANKSSMEAAGTCTSTVAAAVSDTEADGDVEDDTTCNVLNDDSESAFALQSSNVAGGRYLETLGHKQMKQLQQQQQQQPPDDTTYNDDEENDNDVSNSIMQCSSINNASSNISSSRFHMSVETLPVTNVVRTVTGETDYNNTTTVNNNNKNSNHAAALKRKNLIKTDQIVESLVWFSYHIPRTVLEDLISHEVELWRQQHEQINKSNNEITSRTSNRRKNRRDKGSNMSKKRSTLSSKHSCYKTVKSTKSSTSTESFAHDASDDDHDDCSNDDKMNDSRSSCGSVSSLSDDGGPLSSDTVFDPNYSETLIRREVRLKNNDMIALPKAVHRESAILFVDMSGFTKLSTLLDVESLSKVINSYFEMIVSEVINYGGDILKFAGDAFFAEWKVVDDNDEKKGSRIRSGSKRSRKKNSSSNASINSTDSSMNDSAHHCNNPLSELNASLASINELSWDDGTIPPLSMAVLYAAKCATSIVQKYSDYHVTSASGANGATSNGNNSNDNNSSINNNNNGTDIITDGPYNNLTAMLNVHCGIGCGNLVGLHVGDYKENEDDEEATELRREFLILGDPIEQVANAADLASDGQVMASPEAMLALAICCDLKEDQRSSPSPVCVASKEESYLTYESFAVIDNNKALQPYESLRMHCKSLNHAALARLNLQMALYVHPVIRGDELALSAAIQAGKISQPTETLESRHRAEAELRSVFTMFITPKISAPVTGIAEVDQKLYKMLGDIMHVVSRELDRYSGHLRQFIVDDKGVVLIATFGLRGSTFPNMVENNGLPAAYAIHRALKTELDVDNRVGCTFGKVYCGVVGGIRRHEFAVMGAPVNLAARLMGSKVNNGILVDEAVQEQCIGRYSFRSLPPVNAKGYDKPVPILEPIQLEAKAGKKKKSSFPIIGRKAEKRTVLSVARGIIEEPMISQSTMIFLTGESGMGKSALAITILDELKKAFTEEKSIIVTARSSSTETEQRIPLSSYRKIFLSVIRDRCEFDEAVENNGRASITSATTASRSIHSLRSLTSSSRRARLLAFRQSGVESRRGSQGGNFGMLAEESATEIDASPETNRSTRSLRRIIAPPGLSHTQHRQQKNLKYSLQVSSHSHTNRSINGMPLEKTPSNRTSDPLSQSLHRPGLKPEKLRRAESGPQKNLFEQSQSMRLVQPKQYNPRLSKVFREECDESAASLDTTFQKQGSSVLHFEKLIWACEKLDYPFEYADIVGSQFLGFEAATPITHIDGHVPTMDELVEFLALAFIQITDYADLVTVFLDDFHWVDAFSWRIFRVICKKAKRMILLSATRSHDKQALRRMSTAATQESNLQSQMIEISLGPLDFSEIRELMATVLDHKKSSIPDALCTDIFQRTGGLPVYVVQVLENMKRKRNVEMVDGTLKWTAEGLIEKKNMALNKNGAVMEETFLSRFDALDVRVRKVLQTCAVLGLSFALTDVTKVHPEMEEFDIESALECAMDEMILVEQVEDDDDNASVHSGSTPESTEVGDSIRRRGGNSGSGNERFFQFSHAMWRKNVLATMLKERKMELHKLIAEAMEKDEVLILEQSDISRLLTLFDHWKSCGNFCKVAPLALAVGSRLEEWDLAAQSLELYEDALEMAFDGVHPTEQESKEDDEWVQVKAKPIVLDLILRLHICMGMCHQRLGQDYQSILYFQDAYNIIKSASKKSGMSEALVMPIISSLCLLILEDETSDIKSKIEHMKLVQTFVQEAEESEEAVHIGRSLALLALYSAKNGDFRGALDAVNQLEKKYNIEENCEDMVLEYGRDFAMECVSESAQWLYLMGNHDEAESKAEQIIQSYLPLLDPSDTDQMMYIVLPIIQVLSLLDRAGDADVVLKKYVINHCDDYDSPSSEFWAPLFTPLAFLLEIIIMDDEEQHDPKLLAEMEEFVLNKKSYGFDKELERKSFTIMGELCWRLALVKEDDDESQAELLQRARELLEPVAFYPHNEIFQKQTAQALLEAL